MDLSKSIEEIKSSALPNIYMEKLIFDLEEIAKSSIEDIIAIILFGSVARNEIKATSDIDLMVITKEKVKRLQRGEIASILDDIRKGVSTDVVFFTEEEFLSSTSVLIREVRTDGILLWGMVTGG